MEELAPGITVPSDLHETLEDHPHLVMAGLAAIDAQPIREQADIRVLQSQDPVIRAFQFYWRRGRAPTAAERARETSAVVELVRQWSLVYRKKHAQGRQKIQDVWDGVVYEVISCLDEVGTLYKIRPRDASGPERNINRAELRPLLCAPDSPAQQVLTEQQDRNGQVGPSTFTRTEEEAEGDFSSEEDSPDIVLVRSNPVPRAAEPPVMNLTVPAGTREQEDEPPTVRDSGGGQMSLVPLEPHEEERGGPRRSARATAGYHPNPFNLPCSISRPPLDGDGVAAHLVVNSVQVPHRPWE
ncbi:hypothetical protein SKAU_G00139700 [Synaphobranchus kaupii]|uniref:Uncharacterized protein n=1 Tax=Synaphobranchus kaupii TaxID=118154 RepID=A0A9Q1FSC5_SYNKA|nr:hypothetical protein SKAU_G00139700 [Synaphobranchus kaupii]